MRFWVQRLATAILLLLVVSALTFMAMNLLGDPLFNILGPVAEDRDNPASLELIEAAEQEYNLDRPLPVRYALWLGDFVTGDFGVQFSEDGQPPVSDLIWERLPRTVSLLIMAQLMAVIISVPWALFSASRANKPVDKASTFTTFLLIALPNFALAVILKYLFSIRWELFPQAFIANDPYWSRMYQLVLPALTLALPAAAVYQRLLRTDLITTLQEDFILTARAKGVSRKGVLFKHALRPSLFSFVTIFAINTGALIGGALIVENVFLIPGLGRAIVEAILREDFPVVLAIVVLISAAFVFLNLLVDVIYSMIDPRVRSA
ncbi:MAG: ABC transporter permease [Actinomycetota bacterium]